MFRRALLLAVSSLGPLGAGCSGAVAPADASTGSDVTESDAASADAVGQSDAPTTDAGECVPTIISSDSCQGIVQWACAPPADIVSATAAFTGQSTAVCVRHCPATDSGTGWNYISCYTEHRGDGRTTLNCSHCASGRRTEGLTEPDVRAAGNPVGQFLANSATLEEASITAFVRLANELRGFGAPDEVLAALLRAADEERSHAVLVGAAARSRGVVPLPARITPVAARTLLAIALENAVEGCVRETYGALLAAWQATHATDPDLAVLYACLAEDEARHAALSWRVDAWIVPRLSDADRETLEAARATAIASLGRDIGTAVGSDLTRVAGLPDPIAARALFDHLANEVWTS